VLGLVDGAHTALAEEPDELVRVRERRADQGGRSLPLRASDR
jgi:hypothetical protein